MVAGFGCWVGSRWMSLAEREVREREGEASLVVDGCCCDGVMVGESWPLMALWVGGEVSRSMVGVGEYRERESRLVYILVLMAFLSDECQN